MMRTYAAMVLLILGSHSANGSPWQTDLAKAIQESKESGKAVLLYAYDSV